MNIYVGNLALQVTRDELRQVFIPFGQVTFVSIMNDKYIGSGQPRGYGFVEMPSESEGEAAIAGLNGKSLRGMTVGVVQALPLSDSSHNNKRGSRFSSSARQREMPNRSCHDPYPGVLQQIAALAIQHSQELR